MSEQFVFFFTFYTTIIGTIWATCTVTDCPCFDMYFNVLRILILVSKGREPVEGEPFCFIYSFSTILNEILFYVPPCPCFASRKFTWYHY